MEQDKADAIKTQEKQNIINNKKDCKNQLKSSRLLLNKLTGDNFEKVVIELLIQNEWSPEFLHKFVDLICDRCLTC